MSKRKKSSALVNNREVKQIIGILERRADDTYTMEDDEFYWRMVDRSAYPDELARADCIEHTTSYESCKIYYNSRQILKLERAA